VSEAFPPISELVAQTGPMRLLDRVLDHHGDATRCAVDPARSVLFLDARGRVPSWVGIEYMAQCAAAHGGLVARRSGEAPRPGLFLGARRIVFRCDGFEPGHRLEVTARLVAGRSGGRAFECAVLDPARDEPLVEGRLNVMLLRRGAAGARPSP
jgi:predicted hotdog family 3-hydroxylacyl-ACP dehydratase